MTEFRTRPSGGDVTPSASAQQGRFHRDYSRALRRYLDTGSEAGLRAASELGFRAVRLNLDLTTLLSMHADVLRTHARRGAPGAVDAARVENAVATFLAASLAPFDARRHELVDANTALRMRNERFTGRGRDIAAWLHDDVGQLLFALQVALQQVKRHAPDASAGHIDDAMALSHTLDTRLRRLSGDLDPFSVDALGLLSAVQLHAEQLSRATGLPITVRAPREARIAEDVERGLFAAVRDGLMHIISLGCATALAVRLRLTQDHTHLVCVVHGEGGSVQPHAARPRGTSPGNRLAAVREDLASINGTLRVRATAYLGQTLVITAPLLTGPSTP